MTTKRFVWKKDYAVGVKWLDEQHQHFFKLVNEIIRTANKKSMTRKDLLFCLTHLSNHAFFHFDEEEKYLIDSKYPDVINNIAAHKKYRIEIKNFIIFVEDDKSEIRMLADKVAEFASHWLSRHMLGVDKE
ncbi:MAG: hemerythrin domain-containing protein, partial [Patescibacteria group bacterium]